MYKNLSTIFNKINSYIKAASLSLSLSRARLNDFRLIIRPNLERMN